MFNTTNNRKKKKSRTAFGLVFTRSLTNVGNSLSDAETPKVRFPPISQQTTMVGPLVHYSVPPRTPFSDEGTTCSSPFCLSSHRKYYVYSGTSADYTSRLSSRQSSPAKIIGIDGKNVATFAELTPRRIHGFFPPVKLRTTSDLPQLIQTKSPSKPKGKGKKGKKQNTHVSIYADTNFILLFKVLFVIVFCWISCIFSHYFSLVCKF